MNRTLVKFVPLTALIFALAFSACSDDTTPPLTDATVLDDSAVVGDQSVGTDSASDLPVTPLDQAVTPDMAVTSDQAVTPDMAVTPDKAVALDKAVGPDKGQPKDLGPGGCLTNADCTGKSQYCDLKLGCVAPGVCKTKPSICTSLYAPVCGCDNKTYSNSCMANAAGTSVKSKGVCSTSVKTCTQMRTEYTKAITAAKKCSPMLPVVQCKTVVTKELACGCLTAVSKTNATAYAEIVSLTALWKAQSCDKQPWNCPKMPCKSVSTGKCDSTTKTCVDVP